MHPSAKRVLLIEDDFKLASLVREYLESVGYSVLHEGNGAQAPARILSEQPDIVLLDLMLPGLDGKSVCEQVRPKYKGPILMMTALGDERNGWAGLMPAPTTTSSSLCDRASFWRASNRS